MLCLLEEEDPFFLDTFRVSIQPRSVVYRCVILLSIRPHPLSALSSFLLFLQLNGWIISFLMQINKKKKEREILPPLLSLLKRDLVLTPLSIHLLLLPVSIHHSYVVECLGCLLINF